MKKFDDFIRDLDTVEKWEAHMSDYSSYTFIFEDDEVKFKLELYDTYSHLRGYRKHKNGWFSTYIFASPYTLMEGIDVILPYHDYSPSFDLAKEATRRRDAAAKAKHIAENMKWLR